MASVNRTAVLTKLHKVLKKHYQPVPAPSNRSLLENLLFACCLENSPHAVAEQAYQTVSTAFFDWNEVRVSSVKELSEVMKMLPDPAGSAANLKRSLQGVFEGTFSFDLEHLKKQNLGQAVQKLEKCECSPFVVSYVVQTSLGGHSVPLDVGAVGLLVVLGLMPEGAKPKDGCPGLERAIPKNKGMEFGSLLHQPSCEYFANPYSPKLHALLLEIDPTAKARLPKKPPKGAKPGQPAPTPPPAAAASAKPDAKGKAVEAKPAKTPEVKKPDDKKKDAAAKKASPPPAAAAKKPAAPPPKKAAVSSGAKKPAAAKPAGKSATMSKRKPR
jgi:endonuclease-3